MTDESQVRLRFGKSPASTSSGTESSLRNRFHHDGPANSRSGTPLVGQPPPHAHHHHEVSDFSPEQFEDHRHHVIPWKSILLGLFLFTVGIGCLVQLGFDLYNGYDQAVLHLNEKHHHSELDEETARKLHQHERFYPLIISAFLTLTPGVYVTTIIMMAVFNINGVTFDDIPT